MNMFSAKIFDSAMDMIIIHDSNGVITYSNKAANDELGYSSGMTGIRLSEVIPEGIDSYQEQVKFMTVYRQNKTCFNARVKSTRCDDDFVIFIRNDSYAVSLEKQIEKVKADAKSAAIIKNEFVANVTHELRTPVNGILGNANILMESETNPEKIHILETIETGCRTMNSLINNMLDFSKLEAGKFTLESREFDFRNMIDYVRSTHQPKITDKGLKFFVTVSPGIPEKIIGDELRIGQILNNLLSNACKFTHVGKISLEILKTAQQGNKIELFFMVVDTGIGINSSDLGKLFKSFSQVDASVSRKYGGTGLGLNISKQLVEMMGGNISVESEFGKGTMFSFSIWVEIPDDEINDEEVQIDSYVVKSINETLKEDLDEANKLEFGTKENRQELEKQLSKIVLCIEMENWEKAEQFTESIRHLTSEAPKEIKSTALRLKMAVQKSDYEKALGAHQTLNELLKNLEG